MMYVTIFFIMYILYLLKDIILVSQKAMIYQENRNENVHYWKSNKIHCEKSLSLCSLELLICFSHDKIQWLHCVVHYLNTKMNEKKGWDNLLKTL